ncbi:hypothetical protein [Mycobacterium colombiense]|uniref:hypothetical protein n=1 Tax=Mycobacterium colombiense TaxID=339268 RepID=UPI001057E7DD|nr:hypothetical protein [Mycobacterium colombiense]
MSQLTQHRWAANGFGWIDAPGSTGDDDEMRMKPGPVEVRMKVTIAGQVYGRNDVHRGDVIEVPTRDEAERLYQAGLAQPTNLKKLSNPYIPV